MNTSKFKDILLGHVNNAMYSEITGNYVILAVINCTYDEYRPLMLFLDSKIASITGVSFFKTTTYDTYGRAQINSLSINIAPYAMPQLKQLFKN